MLPKDSAGFELVESQSVAGTTHILDNDGDPILLVGPQIEDVKAHLDEPRIVFKPGDTLDFLEKDLDTRRASLARKGLGDVHLEEDSWGDRKLTLKDPNGYTIVFAMPAKRSPEKMAALYAQGGDELASVLAGLSESELDKVTIGNFVSGMARHLADHCEEIRQTLRVHDR